ncbi:MAG: chitosanase [Verrucomicrobiota bacterium]
MTLTPQQKRICERVLNVFETGSADGDYSNISIFNDGPGRIKQVTYGRSQTTEYGNLRELIAMYAAANGQQSNALKPYVAKIGKDSLVGDAAFRQLLKTAGKDPVMQQTQDVFFDRRYFQPAMRWASDQGFVEALSALVIYDSFIHSGSVPGFLRRTFPAAPPVEGGSEKKWVEQYVSARQNWLANHSNAILHTTVYRTKCFKAEIARKNWDLSQLPISANGISVS